MYLSTNIIYCLLCKVVFGENVFLLHDFQRSTFCHLHVGAKQRLNMSS